MSWGWSLALAVLLGCEDEPLPTVVGFEAGATAELGSLTLDGPVADLTLLQVEEDGSTSVVSGERPSSTDIADATIEDPVLDGETAIQLGGAIGALTIELERDEFVGRRVEVRFWQRPSGTRADAHLHWLVGDELADERLGDPFVLSRRWEAGALVTLGSVDFHPTGRRTLRGWEEWSSGPVDYAFGGAAHLEPFLVFRDRAMDDAWLLGGEIRTDRTVALDLLQIVDVGPAAVPERTCRLADEASRCGRKGACALGRCVDAAVRFGGMPSLDVVRADASERDAQVLADWSAARSARDESLEDSVDALRDLGSPRTTARQWWLRGAQAYRDLEDGHSYHGRSLVWYGTGGLCLDLGIADLLGLEEPHPLVTHHFETAPWDDVSQIGDVLVEVDGEPVGKWIEDHAEPLVGATGRSSFRQVENATRSMFAAVAAGSLLTFERCRGPAPCGDTASRFDVDLAEVEASIWSSPPVVPDVLRPTPRVCDHRLDPVLKKDEDRDMRGHGMGRRRRTPVLQLNGFVQSADWGAVLPEVEDRMVIDARLGPGGSLFAELRLAGLFTSTGDYIGMRIDPWLERPPGDAALTTCTFAGDWCYGSGLYELPQMVDTASLRDADLVLLDHSAVSANDWLTMHVQQRCAGGVGTCGATILMGGADTAGGFSPPQTAPAHPGSRYGALVTSYDAKLVYDPTRTSDYLVGTPVEMDVRVLQTQSDAVQGIDTQLEAALEALQ